HVLPHLLSALRPAGCLRIEDGDGIVSMHSCFDPQDDDEHLANRIREGLLGMLEGRGVDFAFGRKLPRLLRSVGLTDVAGDAYLPVSDAVRLLERANALQ